MPTDRVAQQVGGNVFVAEPVREVVPPIDDPADRHVPALEVLVRDVVEVAASVRVMQRAVLAERLPVIAALHAVQHGEAAKVRAVKEVAMAVEVEAPGVAAALAEEFELVRERVIAPDALLKFD